MNAGDSEWIPSPVPSAPPTWLLKLVPPLRLNTCVSLHTLRLVCAVSPTGFFAAESRKHQRLIGRFSEQMLSASTPGGDGVVLSEYGCLPMMAYREGANCLAAKMLSKLGVLTMSRGRVCRPSDAVWNLIQQEILRRQHGCKLSVVGVFPTTAPTNRRYPASVFTFESELIAVSYEQHPSFEDAVSIKTSQRLSSSEGEAIATVVTTSAAQERGLLPVNDRWLPNASWRSVMATHPFVQICRFGVCGSTTYSLTVFYSRFSGRPVAIERMEMEFNPWFLPREFLLNFDKFRTKMEGE